MSPPKPHLSDKGELCILSEFMLSNAQCRAINAHIYGITGNKQAATFSPRSDGRMAISVKCKGEVRWKVWRIRDFIQGLLQGVVLMDDQRMITTGVSSDELYQSGPVSPRATTR